MSWDELAPVYRYLEYAVFGKTLQRRRLQFLTAAGAAQRALILGDGDGRFTAELLRCNDNVQIDYVDFSKKMIELAKKRVASSTRVRFILADARTYSFPLQTYDLIASHFFLDCFQQLELTEIVKKVAASASGGAWWIISEFRQPKSGWRSIHASVWLQTMYTFFRLITGLPASRLPHHSDSLSRQGFVLLDETEERAGLVASELWRNSRAEGIEADSDPRA